MLLFNPENERTEIFGVRCCPEGRTEEMGQGKGGDPTNAADAWHALANLGGEMSAGKTSR